jgi:hypothetical protein
VIYDGFWTAVRAHSAEGTCCPVCGANEWHSWAYSRKLAVWWATLGPWFEMRDRGQNQCALIDVCAKCRTIVS